MPDSQPFLGTPTTFAKAFPQIEKLQVTVVQDIGDYYDQEDWQKTTKYNETNVPARIRCPNTRCRRGGINLEDITRCMVISKDTENTFSWSCDGDEGSPKGRNKGRECFNLYKITAQITYQTQS